MFYARFNPYGIHMLCPGGDAFRAFKTKTARDSFVQAHEWNGNNFVWAQCTRKDVEREKGRHFRISNYWVLSAKERD